MARCLQASGQALQARAPLIGHGRSLCIQLRRPQQSTNGDAHTCCRFAPTAAHSRGSESFCETFLRPCEAVRCSSVTSQLQWHRFIRFLVQALHAVRGVPHVAAHSNNAKRVGQVLPGGERGKQRSQLAQGMQWNEIWARLQRDQGLARCSTAGTAALEAPKHLASGSACRCCQALGITQQRLQLQLVAADQGHTRQQEAREALQASGQHLFLATRVLGLLAWVPPWQCLRRPKHPPEAHAPLQHLVKVPVVAARR